MNWQDRISAGLRKLCDQELPADKASQVTVPLAIRDRVREMEDNPDLSVAQCFARSAVRMIDDIVLCGRGDQLPTLTNIAGWGLGLSCAHNALVYRALTLALDDHQDRTPLRAALGSAARLVQIGYQTDLNNASDPVDLPLVVAHWTLVAYVHTISCGDSRGFLAVESLDDTLRQPSRKH